MSYGFQSINDNSFVQIDSKAPRLCLLTKGSYSGVTNASGVFARAITTQDPEVGDALDGLEESVEQAAQSATAANGAKIAAQESAVTAAEQATASSESATASANSATQAANSKTAAADSATQALSSKNAASSSASEALTSKNSASVSASNAANSASAAATSAAAADACAASIGISAAHIQGLAFSRSAAGVISCSPGVAYIPALNAALKVPTTLNVNLEGLTTSTIYHIYLFSASSTPALEISATAPVIYSEPACQKTGDNSRRYVGSILASSATDCYPFKLAGDVVSYNTNAGAAPFSLVSGGRATTSTSVSALGCAPITTTHIRAVMCNNTDTLPNACFANSEIGAASTSNFTLILGGVSGQAWVFGEIGLDNAGDFTYVLSAVGSSGGVFIRVFRRRSFC